MPHATHNAKTKSPEDEPPTYSLCFTPEAITHYFDTSVPPESDKLLKHGFQPATIDGQLHHCLDPKQAKMLNNKLIWGEAPTLP